MNRSNDRDCAELFFISVFILLVIFMLSRTECRIKANVQGYDGYFSLVHGCMVKHDGQWIDYNLAKFLPREDK